MADIKQAAKWMEEGKVVRRLEFKGKDVAFKSGPFGFIHYCDFFRTSVDEDGHPWTVMLTVDDLLAEDWEIFEWVN
jgi:hypothetical protein